MKLILKERIHCFYESMRTKLNALESELFKKKKKRPAVKLSRRNDY